MDAVVIIVVVVVVVASWESESKVRSPPRIFPLPLGVPSSPPLRSTCTTTLIRHGESTELDVAVIWWGNGC